MAQSSQAVVNSGWFKASGLQDIARALGFSVHPAKLGLALAGIVATLAYGGVLDWMSTRNGGIPADSITDFIVSRQIGRPYVEGSGTAGVFQVWREHERQAIQGLLNTPLHAESPGGLLSGGANHFAGMGRGVWWMVRVHPFFCLLFALGALFIWSLAGGAICRIAAVQFARDEKITAAQALGFVWKRLVR
jgi:hypothetical protein